MILALVRYVTLCNGWQPRTQALFSARYSRSLGTRLRRCGTSYTKRNRDYSRGVTTPLEFISCSFVSPYHASATFLATFFSKLQSEFHTTFCLITDRRIRSINKLQATFTAKQWKKPRYMQSSCTFGYSEPMHGIIYY